MGATDKVYGQAGSIENQRQRVIDEVGRMTPADVVALHHMMFGGRQPADVPDDLWAFVTRSDPATVARKLQDALEDATNYKNLAKVSESENQRFRTVLYPDDDDLVKITLDI